MIPAKEKAIRIINEFLKVTHKDDVYTDLYWNDAKQCALIAVQRNIDLFNELVNNMEYFSNESRQVIYQLIEDEEDLKNEINNL